MGASIVAGIDDTVDISQQDGMLPVIDFQGFPDRDFRYGRYLYERL